MFQVKHTVVLLIMNSGFINYRFSQVGMHPLLINRFQIYSDGLDTTNYTKSIFLNFW